MKKRTYTEKEFKEAVASSVSIREVLLKLKLNPKGGGGYRAFYKTVQDYKVDTSHFKGKGATKGRTLSPRRSIEDYLSNKFPIQSHKLRLRLLKEKIFPHQCSTCGLETWNGTEIPLELDHIDGNHYNNNLNNLRLMCPNCHAQCPTHAGRNKGNASYSPA